MMIGGSRVSVMTGPCRRFHRRHRARRFRPCRPPPGTRGSLATLSGIPRRPSPCGASRRGCPHARQQPRDPPIRVQIAGAGAAHRPGRPAAAAHSRRTTCGFSKTGIGVPGRETGEARKAVNRGHADRAHANHPTGTLERGGADLAISHDLRQDRWRRRGDLPSGSFLFAHRRGSHGVGPTVPSASLRQAQIRLPRHAGADPPNLRLRSSLVPRAG